MASTNQSKSSRFACFNTLLLAVAVAVLVFMQANSGISRADEGHQAVFLTNGQVYFAEVSSTSGNFVNLEDIYYLRVQRDLQPAPEGQPASQSGISLVRLGSELHGPESFMAVNKEHIIFTEPLKEDSAVVLAIAQEKEQRAIEAVDTPVEAAPPAAVIPTEAVDTPVEAAPEEPAVPEAPVEPAATE